MQTIQEVVANEDVTMFQRILLTSEFEYKLVEAASGPRQARRWGFYWGKALTEAANIDNDAMTELVTLGDTRAATLEFMVQQSIEIFPAACIEERIDAGFDLQSLTRVGIRLVNNSQAEAEVNIRHCGFFHYHFEKRIHASGALWVATQRDLVGIY